MARLLLIVSRDEPARYAYFKHVFASDMVDVIVDRRQGDRRQRRVPTGLERRRQDRRGRESVTTELRGFGWAPVRH